MKNSTHNSKKYHSIEYLLCQVPGTALYRYLSKQHDKSSSLDVTIPILKTSILMLREFKFPKIPLLVCGKDKSLILELEQENCFSYGIFKIYIIKIRMQIHFEKPNEVHCKDSCIENSL